jgi:hypothetical protein
MILSEIAGVYVDFTIFLYPLALWCWHAYFNLWVVILILENAAQLWTIQCRAKEG